MTLQLKLSKNAQKDYGFFFDKKLDIDVNYFGINGSFVGKNIFISETSQKIINIFDNFKQQYHFYFISTVKVINKNSRIEEYKKVWKKLSIDPSIEFINCSEELKLFYQGSIFFSSIASFSITNIESILKLFIKNYNNCIIFSSQQLLNLSKETVTYFFKILFKNIDINNFMEINYFNTIKMLSIDNNIIFKWGDDGESFSVTLFFNNKIFSDFKNNLI